MSNEINTNKKEKASDNKKGGCIILLIIIVLALAVLGPSLSNNEFSYGIGAIAAIALGIVIGVYFYNAGKD